MQLGGFGREPGFDMLLWGESGIGITQAADVDIAGECGRVDFGQREAAVGIGYGCVNHHAVEHGTGHSAGHRLVASGILYDAGDLSLD